MHQNKNNSSESRQCTLSKTSIWNIKPILFIDFDGTLCHDKFWRSLDADSFEKIQNFLFGENKSIVTEWMRGVHSFEHINQLISKELNIPFEKVWNIFVADCENMSVPSDVLNQIKNLGEMYHTVLITDNMDCFTRFTVPALKLNSYFDSIINSFDNKKCKSDDGGNIFLQITNEHNSTMEKSILMDNSKSTCVTFSKLGGIAHLVTSNEPLAFWLNNLENELVKS